jgi:transcriptional regulator with XRE-family HTH domain
VTYHRDSEISDSKSSVISSNIRTLRRGRGWNQAKLGELMGWRSLATVCAAEGRRSGRHRRFTVEEVNRLAAIFDVPLSQLTTSCANCAGQPPAGFACLACGTASPEPPSALEP